MPDVLSGLIWVHTICKGYQETTLGGKELIGLCSTKRPNLLGICVCLI